MHRNPSIHCNTEVPPPGQFASVVYDRGNTEQLHFAFSRGPFSHTLRDAGLWFLSYSNTSKVASRLPTRSPGKIHDGSNMPKELL